MFGRAPSARPERKGLLSMTRFTAILIALIFLTGLGCQNAINKAGREVKYSAWEVVGVQKRDLFKKQVTQTKENQAETGEAFKDALERLQEVYKFDGGNLEKEYRKLNSAYEDAEKKVNISKADIAKLETIASDLFEEWAKEIDQIQSSDLKSRSRQTLAQTKSKYGDMQKSLKKAEGKMGPVLAKLRDQTLFLKHNLNAKAVASLKVESARIEKDIASLIEDMNKSISGAEDVIKNLE